MASGSRSVVDTRFPISKNQLAEICQRHHVRKLSLFGSLLRDDFSAESDVDVLVEFEPAAKVGLFKLYDLEQELSQLVGGRRVDINTPKSLSSTSATRSLPRRRSSMSRRDPQVRLKHMLDYAREAVEMAKGNTAINLDKDRKLALALIPWSS